MPPLHFPNELVTLIFEHLYRSLCVHPGEEFLDFPIAEKFIFSQFSLVSRAWHALALPFLVRHCDGSYIEHYTKLVQDYDLARKVESIHFDPKIPEWECYEDLVSDLMSERHVDNYNGFDSDGSEEDYELREECEVDALEKLREDHAKEMAEENELWEPIIELCMPYVRKVEFGRRKRNKLKAERPDDDNFEIRDKLDDREGPGWDLVNFIEAINGPSTRQLRINLPADVELSMLDRNLQGSFPLVEDLTIAFYSTPTSLGRSVDFDWMGLKRLRVLNIDCSPNEFHESIIPSFIAPSADTLIHLHLSVHPRTTSRGNPLVASYLSTLEFPCLETLDLDIPRLSCAEPNFFDRFPCIEIASIPLSGHLSVHNLFKLPISLSHLALSQVDGYALGHLADHLYRSNTSNLHRLQVQGPELDEGVESLPFSPYSDPPAWNESDTEEVSYFVMICKEERIELLYGNITIEDGSETDETESEDDEEEWDFDAEEGEEFEGLWSHETRRDRKLGTSDQTLLLLKG